MKHGTLSTYKRFKCRCELCRVANRDYMRAARLRRQRVAALTVTQLASQLKRERDRAAYWKREALRLREIVHA